MGEMMKLASLWKRILAFSIDAIIVLFVTWLLLLINPFIQNLLLSTTYVFLFAVLLPFIYFIVLEAKFGQTLGKWLFGIKVVAINGRKVSIGGSLIRNLLRIVDIFHFFYITGMLFIIFTKKNQRIGDLAAKTVVMDLKKSGSFGVKIPKFSKNFGMFLAVFFGVILIVGLVGPVGEITGQQTKQIERGVSVSEDIDVSGVKVEFEGESYAFGRSIIEIENLVKAGNMKEALALYKQVVGVLETRADGEISKHFLDREFLRILTNAQVEASLLGKNIPLNLEFDSKEDAEAFYKLYLEARVSAVERLIGYSSTKFEKMLGIEFKNSNSFYDYLANMVKSGDLVLSHINSEEFYDVLKNFQAQAGKVRGDLALIEEGKGSLFFLGEEGNQIYGSLEFGLGDNEKYFLRDSDSKGFNAFLLEDYLDFSPDNIILKFGWDYLLNVAPHEIPFTVIPLAKGATVGGKFLFAGSKRLLIKGTAGTVAKGAPKAALSEVTSKKIVEETIESLTRSSALNKKEAEVLVTKALSGTDEAATSLVSKQLRASDKFAKYSHNEVIDLINKAELGDSVAAKTLSASIKEGDEFVKSILRGQAKGNDQFAADLIIQHADDFVGKTSQSYAEVVVKLRSYTAKELKDVVATDPFRRNAALEALRVHAAEGNRAALRTLIDAADEPGVGRFAKSELKQLLKERGTALKVRNALYESGSDATKVDLMRSAGSVGNRESITFLEGVVNAEIHFKTPGSRIATEAINQLLLIKRAADPGISKIVDKVMKDLIKFATRRDPVLKETIRLKL